MPPAPRPNALPRVLAIVAVVAVAALALVFILSRGGEAEPAAETAPVEDPHAGAGAPTEVQGPQDYDFSHAESRDDADLLATGPVDAPVALVVFSDYQCPFCAQWSAETLPVMLEYAEAGDLRIEWRDVNVFGEASERASRAAYAAAEQDAFWEYHDALFAGGETRSETDLGDEALREVAASLDLDLEQFDADFASEETRTAVAAHAELGVGLGAFSTPSFIMGGQPITGAQPTEVFVEAFETAMAASG